MTIANSFLAMAERVEQAGPEQQRELLGDAWELIAPLAFGPLCADRAARFDSLLDAEGFESAALLLVPDGWGYMVAAHDTGPEAFAAGCFPFEGDEAGQCGALARAAGLAIGAAALRAHVDLMETAA